MLILDKRKAVEHVMALITTASDASAEVAADASADDAPKVHVRTYQRVAAYERRAAAAPVPVRRAERRRRRFAQGAESAPA
jgi:hypothetical protein